MTGDTIDGATVRATAEPTDRFAALELKYVELRASAANNAIRVPGVVNAAAIAVIVAYLSNVRVGPGKHRAL